MSHLSHVGRRSAIAVVLPLGFLFITACGKKDDFTLVPVSGKITVGKTPLSSGTITFWPDAAKGNTANKAPSGIIEADGSYKLRMGTSEGIKDGAPPGWYKVTISKGNPVASTNKKQPVRGPVFDPSLESHQKTTLQMEVKEGAAPGAYDLKLTDLASPSTGKKR